MTRLATTMRGAFLPGNSTVELRTLTVPEPGHGQVLLAMKASSICGSDIRAIYRAHLGEGAERYQDVVAGHEPAGQVVAVGPSAPAGAALPASALDAWKIRPEAIVTHRFDLDAAAEAYRVMDAGQGGKVAIVWS